MLRTKRENVLPTTLAAPNQGPATLPGGSQDSGGTFRCAVCLDDHPLEELFTASMCGHSCMCREAARKTVLQAIR